MRMCWESGPWVRAKPKWLCGLVIPGIEIRDRSLSLSSSYMPHFASMGRLWIGVRNNVHLLRPVCYAVVTQLSHVIAGMISASFDCISSTAEAVKEIVPPWILIFLTVHDKRNFSQERHGWICLKNIIKDNSKRLEKIVWRNEKYSPQKRGTII